VADAGERKNGNWTTCWAFLGANPVKKVDRAFDARYGSGVMAYLGFE
jgi:hypothetical protein